MKNGNLFLYEHTVRELDSIVITKMILDKLYGKTKVKIADIAFTQRINSLKIFPSILLVPYLYDYFDWLGFVQFFVESYEETPKIVNMHWEQVGSKNSQDFLAPKDRYARDIYHVSWSNEFTNFLVKTGSVNPNYIWQIGNPRADLLNRKFWKSYISEQQFKKSLDIPLAAPVYLFIMSFSGAFVSESNIRNVEKKGGFINYRNFVRLSQESFELSMKEVRKFARILSDKNGYVLLRPHPYTPLSEVKKWVKDIKNIRVSRNFPLNEVIFNSTGVISWLSTGTIDSYIFKKPTVILRPKEIPEEYDIDFLNGFNFVSNAQEINDFMRKENNYLKNENLLKKTVGRIYGKLDGTNCLSLAQRLHELDKDLDKNPSNYRIKNWGVYYNTLLKTITKDIPKNFLARYFPNLLPGDLKRRFDDRAYMGMIRKLEKKYDNVVDSILNDNAIMDKAQLLESEIE